MKGVSVSKMKKNVMIMMIFMVIFCFCGCTKKEETVVEGKFYTETAEPEQTYEAALPVMEDIGTDEETENSYQIVKKPVRRTKKEVVSELKRMGENDDVIKNIYDNRLSYPDNMLEALANNPEMKDFVNDYLKNGKVSVNTGLTKKEKKEKFPLFLQWDERWGYEPYGDDSCVGLAGCGPACLAMVLYYLTGNDSITPDAVAEYSMKNGYYMKGTGTAWALMEDLPRIYNINVTKPALSKSEIKRKLDSGALVICAMREGDFTVSGHFIVIYGYDDDGFMVNDPNCIERSGRRWPYGSISSQIKSIWAYSR